MISSQSKEIQALVDDIRDGQLLLPELQRRYVWKSTQVRDLFDSLYHQYPSGQLLIWETDDLPFSHSVSLEKMEKNQRRPQLLLDGQQRLTSLAAVMLGRPLYIRDVKRPIDIAFNVFTEKFEVAGPRQSKDAGWVSLSRLFTEGVLTTWIELQLDPKAPEGAKVFDRLKRIENIKTYKYQVNVLEKLSYEEVTHIFVRINSGGTKLGTADLALAQMSSRWRGVTEELQVYESEVSRRPGRLYLDTGILLRIVSALLTGQTRPSYMFRGERGKVTIAELEAVWKRVKAGMDQAIAFLSSNCRINRLDLLPTQYILIPLAVFFDKHGNNVTPRQIRDLQRWTYLAMIWARYSGAAETAADQDVNAAASDTPVERLIENLEDKIGKNRIITERELREQRKNSPMMLMAYVLARYASAEDWFNGVVLENSHTLEFHHIFPKEVLREKYDLKLDSRTVDQVANLAFLSKRANLKIRSQSPSDYLPKIAENRLRAQYVPLTPNLWTVDQFERFTQERRQALADAVNRLLQSLTDEPAIFVPSDKQVLETRLDAIEHQMRDLIVEKLTVTGSDQAWELIPAQIRKPIDNRSDRQQQELPFLRDNDGSLTHRLSFCQFSDYAKIVDANWPYFGDVFGNRDTFLKHYTEATNARNAIKHNRPLHRGELASAEAGLIWLEDCLLSWADQLEEEEDENTIDEEENGEGNGEE